MQSISNKSIGCPKRDLVEPPDKLPMSATPENRKLLEEWIRTHYCGSAFNSCKRQRMPCSEGPPIEIHTKPGAIPLVVHKPAAVPLHWRAAVKAGIDADVASIRRPS